eukprot:c16962_g1_i1.p1 GENE.c16962_g1_i1~~c16962_g1_i1.p1  ORF type:complete len:180 (-),score=36.48 c16962_g1_i1:73-612(-)
MQNIFSYLFASANDNHLNNVALQVDANALKATFMATFALAVVHWSALALQTLVRTVIGARPPEDQKYVPKSVTTKKQTFVGSVDDKNRTAGELCERANRIVANNLEQIPLAVAISWASLFCTSNPQMHAMLVTVLPIARAAHSICFAFAWQPWRSIAFVVAWACAFGILVNGMCGLSRV